MMANTPRKPVAFAPEPAPPPTSEPAGEPEAPPAPMPEQESAVDRLTAMIARSAGAEQGKVRVRRIRENGALSLCNEYRPEDFEQGGGAMLIRKQFGAGRYLIEVFGIDPATRRFKGYARETIDIEPSLAPDPNDQLGGLAERLDAILAQRQAAPDAPSSNMAQFKDMLQMLALVKGLFAPPPPPALTAQLGELITLVKGTQDLGRVLNPPDEPKDELLEIAKQALPIIGKALERPEPASARQLTPVALPPTLAAPAPVSMQVPIGGPTAPNGAGSPNQAAAINGADFEVTDDEFTASREAIRSLNTLAMLGVEAEGTARAIYSQVPDDVFDILKEPDWFEKLVGVDGNVKRFRAWYTDVRNLLLQFWDSEPPENGAGGDPSNDSSHGVSSP